MDRRRKKKEERHQIKILADKETYISNPKFFTIVYIRNCSLSLTYEMVIVNIFR